VAIIVRPERHVTVLPMVGAPLAPWIIGIFIVCFSTNSIWGDGDCIAANAPSPYLPSTPGQPMTPNSASYLPGTPGGQPMTPGTGGLDMMSPVLGKFLYFVNLPI
jgi:hypothetical protein